MLLIGLGSRLRILDMLIAERLSDRGSFALGFTERLPVDEYLDDVPMLFDESLDDISLLDPYFKLVNGFFDCVDSFSFASLVDVDEDVVGDDVDAPLSDEYRPVYVETVGTGSRFKPALRYVPPEYDGLYDAGDDMVPKRGLDFASAVTSSRDEYCN